MTLPEACMLAIVVAVGLPAARWNATAAALVVAWCAGEAVYLATGNSLPVEIYLYPDIFVLAVIMAKQEYCNLRPYRSTLHQLKCVVLERSPCDRVIMLMFPLAWALYAADIHAYYKWWALYLIVVVQFIAAGIEAIAQPEPVQSGRNPKPGRNSERPPFSFVFGGGLSGRRRCT